MKLLCRNNGGTVWIRVAFAVGLC